MRSKMLMLRFIGLNCGHSDELRAFEDVVTRQRLIVDEDKKLGVLATVREIFRYQNDRPSAPTQTQVMVAVRDGDLVGHRHFPQSTNWVKLDGETRDFGWASDRPDFRFIGLYTFPFSSGSLPPKIADSILEMCSTKTVGRTYQQLPNNKVAIYFRDDKNPSTVRQSTQVFDLRNGVLDSSKAGRRKAPERKYAPDFQENYTWGSVAGVHVPLTIVGGQKKRSRDKNRDKLIWIEQYEASFRWFVVNDELDPPKEMMHLLKDLNSVLRFVEAKSRKNVAKAL